MLQFYSSSKIQLGNDLNMTLKYFKVTKNGAEDAEVDLARELGIPLFGTDTKGAFWGTKTGNRQVFRAASAA